RSEWTRTAFRPESAVARPTPWATPDRTTTRSGRDVQLRTIDVLAVEDGRVSAIWVVADDMGLLTQ
ncbi:MAG TPA: hypothetical protein VFI46_09130, partial [Jiangellaceae bacterium]|nr:hypothetical protein [Jiangellaceae bacterium]